MDTTPLCVLVNKITASNRIVFGDLRRLRRDVLPAGATSREEIETLLSLDSAGQVDEDWPEYLVETVVQFVLSSSTPPGCVDADTAVWLESALSAARPRTAAAIVRAILQEAQQVELPRLYPKKAKRLVIGPQPRIPEEHVLNANPGCEHPGPAGREVRLEVEGLGG